MTERLFFALWPGEQQREELVRAQRELLLAKGRKTHPEDLHMTLVFLGDLEAESRACAERAADRVKAIPFALVLDRIGCFSRAKILWCGASERPRPLQELLSALETGLQGCGFRPERRPFNPHVTLARRARALPARELEQPVAWPVSDFSLVIARPGERPRYRVERSWPLIS